MATKVLNDTNIQHVLEMSSGAYNTGDFVSVDPLGRTFVIEVSDRAEGAYSQFLKTRPFAPKVKQAS